METLVNSHLGKYLDCWGCFGRAVIPRCSRGAPKVVLTWVTKGITIEPAESVESDPNSWRLKFEMSPCVGVLFQPRRSSNPLTLFCRCVLFEPAIVGFRIFCSCSLLCTCLGLWFNHMMHQTHILSNMAKQHKAVVLSFCWWWSLRQFVMTR